jgi:integrase
MGRENKVTWHKSKRWCFTKTVGGARRFFYADPNLADTRDGKRKAEAWMAELIRSLEGRTVTAGDWTLDDLRLAYLTWCKRRVAEKAAKPHTFDGHRKHLNLICATPRAGKTCGHVLAREMTPRVADELCRSWREAGRGATTIRNRIGSLQAMLNWASKPRSDRPMEKLIESNPIAGFELPKAEYRGDRYAPASEVEAFLGWVEARAEKAKGPHARFERLTARLIRVVAETGARPGELCALEWRHYDPERRAITFPPEEHKTGGKTKKPRHVLLTAEVAGILDAIRADADRHPSFVFTHSVRRLGSGEEERLRGSPWNSNALSRKIKELRRQAISAGIKLEDKGIRRMHLYRLRHTHITADMQSPEKPSIVDVAAMHGTSVKMIETTYLHSQLDHLHGVLDRLRGPGATKKGKE